MQGKSAPRRFSPANASRKFSDLMAVLRHLDTHFAGICEGWRPCGWTGSYRASNRMSRFTRTVNLYPAGTLIVGCTFRLRRVICAPVWLSSWPTALPAVWVGVGYVRALWLLLWEISKAAVNMLVRTENPTIRR